MTKSNASSKDFDICVGVITSVNGVKGHVKIRSFTEKPSDIANFNALFDQDGKEVYKVSVVTSKKDYIIAGIAGISNRNEAEKLRNTKLFIKRSALPHSKGDEYYHADLVNLEARSEEGVQLGIVKNIVNFGAGDIIEIYDISTEKTIYYPFTKQFVPEVNIEKKYITLKPLEEVIAAAD
jgi:16S rRNA processing protein RimM